MGTTLLLGFVFQLGRIWPDRTDLIHELGGGGCAKSKPTVAKLEAQVFRSQRIRRLHFRLAAGKSLEDVCIKHILRTTLFKVEKEDWNSSSIQSYKVYQAMFRVIKESENVDERQHCFLIQTSGQESRYFSMETRQDLLKLESAWHRAVCRTVSQMGVI